ncbi:MAG: MFS transporter [Verrucomicrobiota bacterium]|nr:MFS transporter [Verrucomicrobiota bacterium]
MFREAKPGAVKALALLLGINLFNYIDRQVLAGLEPDIRATFFRANDANAMAATGWLGTAFLFTYMLSAPALGWLSDRFSRWVIIGSAVIFWSVASGMSGLAATFTILLLTRVFVGIGEGGYGPAAPTLLADLFPIEIRGRILAIFCAAIPVGSAFGYVVAALIGPHFGWRVAFLAAAVPGLILGLFCFRQRDPRATGGAVPDKYRATRADYLRLWRTPSYVLNTLAQTAMTFAIGGLGFWVAAYLRYRGQPDSGKLIFGGITVVAGLCSTLLGGSVADRLRNRLPGSYFLVSGIGMLLAFPFFVVSLYVPFPLSWYFMAVAIFFIFLNTGPANTALANVSLPKVRGTAFAINILIIHLLGDAAAFPAIGFIAGHTNLTTAFLVVSGMMLLAGVFWLIAAKFLADDTAAVEDAAGERAV